MINLFCILNLIIPWVIIPIYNSIEPIRLPKEAFFDIICMAIITYAIKNGLRVSYRNKLLSIFVGYVFFCIVMTMYLPYMLSTKKGYIFVAWSFFPTIHFFLGLFLVFIILSCFTKDDYKKIAKCFCLSSVLIASFGYLQYFGLNPLGNLGGYAGKYDSVFVSLLGHANLSGAYLALTLPMFLFLNSRLYYFGLVFCFIGLLLTKSMLPIFCGLFGVLVYIVLNFRKNKKVLFSVGGLLASALSFLILNPHTNHFNGYLSGRIKIWELVLEKVRDNPLFGQGLGVLKTWNLQFSSWVLQAHNDWLERVCEIGIIGTVLLLIVIINSIVRFNYKSDNKVGFAYLSSFAIFLLLMVASFPLEIAPLALYGLVLFCGVEKL